MKRSFTPEDDVMIIRQSHGEFSVKHLERMLRTSPLALERRARELGVELRIRRYGQRMKLDNRRWNSKDLNTPLYEPPYKCDVGMDHLLAKLRIFHPGRDKE